MFNRSQYILEKYVFFLNLENSNVENFMDDVEDFQNVEESLDENDKNEIDVFPEHFIKQEAVEEELPLTDYVILQITDDKDDEEIEAEKQEDIDRNENDEELNGLNSNITAEFIDPDKYKIEKLVPKPRVLYNCPFCNKPVLTKRRLDQHTKICQKYTLQKCEFCDQQFSSLTKKHYHIKVKHSNALNKESKCQICDEVFENQKARSYHIKTKHALKKFVCKICGKAFHFKNGLATHMDTHTKDQFKEICPECGKGFHYRGRF